MATYYCEKCQRTMDGTQFYTSLNTEKYKNDGKLPQCKKCITMHINNYKPETFLWILQEIDVPWVPDSWNKLLAKYNDQPEKLKGTTILGRYLSAMKLNQFNRYRWKDTEHLQEEQNLKIQQTMERQGYSQAQIDSVIQKGTFEMPEEPLREPVYEDAPMPAIGAEPQSEVEDYFAEQAGTSDDDLDLTDEDRTYLRLKWGKAYKAEEWVWLEQMYEEMMNSYDIQTAGHIDTLKLICKTSLKANQLIDIGD